MEHASFQDEGFSWLHICCKLDGHYWRTMDYTRNLITEH